MYFIVVDQNKVQMWEENICGLKWKIFHMWQTYVL